MQDTGSPALLLEGNYSFPTWEEGRDRWCSAPSANRNFSRSLLG